MSYTQIGVLYAVREVVINLLEVISGMVADILGRKRAMLFSFLAYIVSFLLFYLLNSFGGFVLAFVFYGIGDAFRSGTHKAMILNYLKRNGWEEEKTAYYGKTRSWSQRGAAIASIISAGLVFYTGSYQSIFLLSIIPYLMDLALMMSYPSYLNGVEKKGDASVRQLFVDHFQDIKKAFSGWKPFRILMFASSYTGYYKASKDYLQPLLAALAVGLPVLSGITDEKRVAVVVGLIYSLLYVINAYVSQQTHIIESKFKNVKQALSTVQLLGWSGGLLAGAAYLAGWHTVAIVMFMGVIVIQNARRPMAVKFVSDRFNDKMMATVLSAESQSQTLFTSLFAVTLGVIAQHLGVGYALLFVSFSLILMYFLINSFNKSDF